MAFWASPSSFISTNPNPRDRPVSRSVITWARVTVPCWPNSCSRSSDVVLNGRFPTYRFFATPHPRGATPRVLRNKRQAAHGGPEGGTSAAPRDRSWGCARDRLGTDAPRQAIAMRIVFALLPRGRTTRPALWWYYTVAAAGCNTGR